MHDGGRRRIVDKRKRHHCFRYLNQSIDIIIISISSMNFKIEITMQTTYKEVYLFCKLKCAVNNFRLLPINLIYVLNFIHKLLLAAIDVLFQLKLLPNTNH